MSASILVNELKHTSFETSLDTAVATVWMERIYRHYLLPALNDFGWMKTSLRPVVTFRLLCCLMLHNASLTTFELFLPHWKEISSFQYFCVVLRMFTMHGAKHFDMAYMQNIQRELLWVFSSVFPSSHFIQWNMKIQSISNISFDHFPFQRDFSLFLYLLFCDF